MEWMIICIVVVGIFCFFVGFGIRRSNNNRQNEVSLVNTDINKDLSISHSSYQINSFGKSSIQNLAISKTNLIINNNIVSNIIDDLKRDNNKGMSVLRIPGKFRQRLEELEKIEKQQISRRYRKIKSKIKDMPAPEPIYEDIKEDDKI